MRAYLPFALGALSVTARSVPHSSLDEGILSESMEPTEPVWNCSVRTWVRAPDLAPNMRTKADVRVVTEGSECTDIIGMDVGLRMSERAVYKFRAPGVDLPEQPEMDWSMQGSYSQNESIFKVDSFGPSSWGQSPAQQAFEVKQVEYAKVMENPSMWHAAGVERKVFDQKLTMKAPKVNASGFESETIQSFEVHTPNTNLPSTLRNMGHNNYGEVEMVTSESMFEYYTALTLKNGTIVDYPSGQSGFLPVASPGLISNTVRSEQVEIRNPRLDEEKESHSGDRHGPIKLSKRRKNRGPWDYQRTPSCDDGNLAEFIVDIHLPDNATFTPGQEVLLNTSISRRGNGSEVATHLSLIANGCRSQHWARTYAHSADLKNLTLQCNEGVFFGGFEDDSNSLLAMQPFNKTRYVERLEDELQYCSEDGRRPFSTLSSSFSDWGAGKLVKKLDPTLRNQSVLVSFKVPAGAVPDFEGTFRDFTNQLMIVLRTEFTCEKGYGSGRGDSQDDFEEDTDELWEPLCHMRQLRCPQREAKRPSHRQAATVPIKIRAADISDSQDYREHGAKAPKLLPDGHTGEVIFDAVNTDQTAETDPAQLQQSRYMAHQRMPPRHCVNSDDMRCGRGGGEYAHVAEAWRRFEMRDELKVIRREVLEKYAKEHQN